MIGIVVTGGETPPLSSIENYLKEADLIAAADSGLEAILAYGFEPDLIVGDMDSLSDRSLLERFSSGKIHIYSEDKDYTDTELAIAHLKEAGCNDIRLIGGGGGRLDHIIALYSLFSGEFPPNQWITANEKIFLVKEKFCINLNKGTVVSLFPVGDITCTMKSSGLKWPLNNLRWKIGDSGISNVALEENVSVNMNSGSLIMIVPLDK